MALWQACRFSDANPIASLVHNRRSRLLAYAENSDANGIRPAWDLGVTERWSNEEKGNTNTVVVQYWFIPLKSSAPIPISFGHMAPSIETGLEWPPKK